MESPPSMQRNKHLCLPSPMRRIVGIALHTNRTQAKTRSTSLWRGCVFYPSRAGAARHCAWQGKRQLRERRPNGDRLAQREACPPPRKGVDGCAG